MKSRLRLAINCIYILLPALASAQGMLADAQFDPEARGDQGLRIVFYNVENLFDTFDDPLTADEEFTPRSSKTWNHYRYQEKLNHIAKTLIAVGGWEPPDMIGLCEVENFQVLVDLTTRTPLQKYPYQIIHENSPDSRGIDNALLFKAPKLQKISQKAIVIDDEKLRTRDILYASFSFNQLDTLHVLVNHWPSRSGGKELTESKRLLVAQKLKDQVQLLQNHNAASKILAMGDFNDEPTDKSIVDILAALPADTKIDVPQLYNMSIPDFKKGKGTIVFRDIDFHWYLFDQMIVSGSLLSGYGLTVKGNKNFIFCQEWLLQDGRPYRSYQGPIYIGGYSDHLPIFIDLYYQD